jgi:hypothetical protein
MRQMITAQGLGTDIHVPWVNRPYGFGMRSVLLIIMLPEAMNRSDSA